MIDPNAPAAPALCQMNAASEIVGAQTGASTGWEIGLTKREHFAVLALQGLLASSEDPESLPSYTQICEVLYARRAVMFADALIAELNK